MLLLHVQNLIIKISSCYHYKCSSLHFDHCVLLWTNMEAIAEPQLLMPLCQEEQPYWNNSINATTS